MRDLSIIKETMSSIEIAELTGKPHNDVMKAIRVMEPAWEKVQQGKFSLMFKIRELPNGGHKEEPYYELTKTECLYVATKFNDEARAKLVIRWEQLEKERINGGYQIPSSFSAALRLAAAQMEQIESQQKQIEVEKRSRVEAEIKVKESAPAVAFTKAIQSANSSCLIGELAKLIAQNGYAIGEKRLFAYMRANGYLGKHGERYNIPNQQYIEQGLFELKKGVRSGNGGVLHTTVTPKVTGKGQVYFVNKFIGKEAPDADQL